MKNSNLEFIRALIKEMNDSYKSVEEKKKLSGGQSKIAAAAPPEDEITAADFKALRGMKKEDQSLSPHDKITYDNSGKIIKKERLFLRGKVNIKGPNRDPDVRELNLSANQEVRPFEPVNAGGDEYGERDSIKADKDIPLQGMTENHEVSEGLGNDIGDKVYFKPDSNFGKKFPSSEGYYAIIQDVTPASNYNMNALYKVVVHDKDDNEIGAIRADWTNFSTKPINENHEGQDHEVSMANNSLDSILWAVGELKKHLGDQERDIPAWIQDHITNAENYIVQAAKNFHDYGAEEPTDDMSLAAMAPAELNEMIKKVGKKYNVYSKKGKKLGSHPSKKKAQKQMAAIEISKQGK